LMGGTDETISASMGPRPKNLVYAEMWLRCGLGSQLIPLPAESGVAG